MISKVLKEAEDKMKKSIEVVRQEFAKIRTGKATTALLDGIKAEYYGSHVPLNQLANISVSDIHTLVVQPWDKSALQAIEKAILTSELGLNPINDGNILRIPIPPLTEERRKDLVKLCKKFAEDGRIAVRNVRRDSIEHLRKLEKEEHFSEDERKRAENEVQKLTDKYIKLIDELLEHKEKEIMEV
ncbi:MAG: ribosome recycling factor [Ignavibacteria bacterium]|jgi:ribosome recycling factor|nr:ribosome recycling factor [Ignavibacteria bacterium]MDH7526812.1 ribosome recycling factor [Ignavibacteria bacterium]NPV11649.1 ribosome recycling factor [Ignavibacteria bacterium]